MSDDTEEPDFEKGDYVEVIETGEQGRIIGPGAQPGTWRVKLIDGVRGNCR
jgi:hypothetical protein